MKCNFACVCASCCAMLIFLVGLGLLGVFVLVPKLGPHLAQNMMDKTVVTLENSTLVPISLDKGSAYGILYNKITMHTPGPFGVTIQPYRTTLSTYGQEFGYFQFPEEKASAGDNYAEFNANFTITNVSTVTNWTVEWLLMDPKAVIQLEITGTASVKAFGHWTFYPEQDVILWCTQLPNGPDNGISMKCTPDVPTNTSDVEPAWEALEQPEKSFLAVNGLPDCSTTACVSKCQCAEQKCEKELTACLADQTCGSSQECADKCPCGDNICLAKCAALHPSPLAIAALKCLNKNCPTEIDASEHDIRSVVV